MVFGWCGWAPEALGRLWEREKFELKQTTKDRIDEINRKSKHKQWGYSKIEHAGWFGAKYSEDAAPTKESIKTMPGD